MKELHRNQMDKAENGKIESCQQGVNDVRYNLYEYG